MLGLADRARIIDLFEALMRGAIAPALDMLKEQYDHGADPAQVLADLAGFVHFVTRLKVAPGAARDAAMTPQEVRRGGEMAAGLSIRVLTRAWQMLLKGLQEVREAPRPLAAADMVLVRIAHAADLPTLDEALKSLDEALAGASAPSAPPAPRGPGGGPSAALRAEARAPVLAAARPDAAPRAAAQPVVALARYEDVVALAEKHRDIQLKVALERDVRLVTFERGRIDFALAPGGSTQLPQLLSRRLQEWTGERWMVALSQAPGAPTLRETKDAAEERKRSGVAADPAVRSVLEAFPGAEIVELRGGPETAPAPPAGEATDEDVIFVEETIGDDDL